MRFGILSTRLSHCSWMTLCHSWRWNLSTTTLFNGLWPSILLLITFQRYSMRFRSWDWASHDRVLIWWSFIHTLIDLAVWHGALSCWKKIILRVGEYFQRRRKQVFFQLNLAHGLIHVSVAKTHLPDSSHPEAPADHQPSSTTFHSGFEVSPGLCLIIRGPGVRPSWKLDSSEKRTLLKSSMV